MDMSIHQWKQCLPLLELLKACIQKKDLRRGSRLHDHILSRGLHKKNRHVASSLIHMNAKCGALVKARQVLEDLSDRDVVSWSALIAGYAHHCRGHDALDCFSQMQREGIPPNAITFISILKACGGIGAIDKGKQIHDEIARKGLLTKNIVLGNALVDMYAKCGFLAKAQDVFNELPARNVITWNTLISGYTQQEQPQQAFDCFTCMQREGISPSEATYACILKVCGSIGAIDKGIQIHDELISKGILLNNVLGNALVNMYAKCGFLSRAQQVHDELAIRDVISWNALMTGYNQEGNGHASLACFEAMEREGVTPNEVTFICALKSCGTIRAVETGETIHEDIVNRGLLEKHITIGNALVDMYAKCGALEKAQQVLQVLPVRDIVSWSALISGYTQAGQAHEALDCFSRMQKEGLAPNEVTFVCVLKACGNIQALSEGKHAHDEIVGRGLLKENVMLGNALVDMYVQCGELANAHQVVEVGLEVRNVVSWNVLIAGYAQEEQGHKALTCFTSMQREGLIPNAVTFACILKACGSIGAVDKGKQIHNIIMGAGLMDENIVLGTALMDMYVKCGVLSRARQVLEGLPLRNVVSWSALISGYALAGRFREAMDCFEQMEREGLPPNETTFLCLLNALSHSGRSNEAEIYYEIMKKAYGIAPKAEHNTCMVLAFGLSGQFDKAISVIMSMPYSGDASLWVALLSTCRRWGNVTLGKLAFDQVIRLDDQIAASYTLMADIFGNVSLHEDAQKIEDMRVNRLWW